MEKNMKSCTCGNPMKSDTTACSTCIEVFEKIVERIRSDDSYNERFTMYTNEVVPNYQCTCLLDYIHGRNPSDKDEEGDCCSHCGKELLPISKWVKIEKDFRSKQS